MAKNDETVKVIAGLVVLAILLSGIVLAASSRLQAGSNVDVDTIGYNLCADTDAAQKNLRGGGRFTDPYQGDVRKVGEVFSTTRLWYAWFKDGESRPVTAEAVMVTCGNIGIDFWPDHAYYDFSYSTDGRNWQPFYQDRIPTGELASSFNIPGTITQAYTGAFEIILDGFRFCTVPTTNGCPAGKEQDLEDGSALKVEVYLYRIGFPSWGGRYKIAEDQIELRSAMPNVAWQRAGYEVGQTATATWEIPTTTYRVCNSDGTSCEERSAYFLEILDMNTGLAVPGWDRIPLGSTTGAARVQVTEGLVSTDLDTCQNRLRAQILTTIIVADLEDTAVRAPETSLTGGPAPEVTSITFDKREYQEGDPVTIKWKATGNITKYHVTAQIGGLIAFDEDVDGTEASFVAARAGILEVQVTAYNRCTASDVKRVQATVGNVYPGMCELFPELPQCTGIRSWIGMILAALAILAVIVAFFAIFWILSRAQPKAGYINLLVALVLAGLIAIAFIASGVMDPILLPSMIATRGGW